MVRTPCCKEEGLKKGAWTHEEDQKLIAYIQLHGEGGWRTLPEKAGLKRCGKSCRLRWANYLRPDIKRGEFTPEEDDTIIKLHALKGNKWAAIATCLAGRTDNEIKNYWNTNLKKRLKQKGIDPITHKPITLTSLDPNKHKPASTSGSAKLLNRVASKYGVHLNRDLLTGLITGNSNVTDSQNSGNAYSLNSNKVAAKSVSIDTTSTLSGFSDDIIEFFSNEKIFDMYTNVDSFGIMEEFKDILSYNGAGAGVGVIDNSPEVSVTDDKIELLDTWNDGGVMDLEKFMRSLDSKVGAIV